MIAIIIATRFLCHDHQHKAQLKDQSTRKKNLRKNYAFEKFMKNGAFFVFTASSESL
jgi:hypothetical protein